MGVADRFIPCFTYESEGEAAGVSKIISKVFAGNLKCYVVGSACCRAGLLSFFETSAIAASPRYADLLIVAGAVTEKAAPLLRRIYEQIPEPKWVLSVGSCANSGGPFYYDGYSVLRGVDTIIPVDVYVAGCPPRSAAILDGLNRLKERLLREGLLRLEVEKRVDVSQYSESPDEVSVERLKVLHNDQWRDFAQKELLDILKRKKEMEEQRVKEEKALLESKIIEDARLSGGVSLSDLGIDIIDDDDDTLLKDIGIDLESDYGDEY